MIPISSEFIKSQGPAFYHGYKKRFPVTAPGVVESIQLASWLV